MHLFLFPVLWLVWVAYWLVRSRNVKVVARRESPRLQLFHVGSYVVIGILIWRRGVPLGILDTRFLPAVTWPFWAGAVLTVAGLLFTVWARHHLGRNWSLTVDVKEKHQLITSGPYAVVRHPIYSGLLLALAGSAMAGGEWRGVLAVALALWVYWLKLRTEEHWMREAFGEEYQAYSQRVPALIPFL